MSSSSWTTRMPGTGSATTSSTAAGPLGMVTSSRSPPLTRWLLPTTTALTLTSPAAARSAARVRERPKRRAMAASTRSPSRPSGTRKLRWSAIGVLGMVHGGPDRDPALRQDHDDAGRHDDGDVGDVADEEAEVVDEVDDVAAPRAGLAGEPVDEVADGAAQQQPQRE